MMNNGNDRVNTQNIEMNVDPAVENASAGKEMKNLMSGMNEDMKWKISLGISAAASLASLVAWFGGADYSTKSACMMLALVGALAAYILAGGISTAVKWAVGIAKWGWFIVPHFPIDLMFGLVAGAAGLMAFLFFPVIIVGKRYMERTKQLA